jgi:signal transduction histidine kinase
MEYAMRETGGVLEVSTDNIKVQDAIATFHPELQPGSYVRVRVRDTGVGIPADIMDRIFEPFFTTKGVGEGTGMGLAIVHGIVTRHSGVITVESKPGEGSTFTIYLPQIAPDRGLCSNGAKSWDVWGHGLGPAEVISVILLVIHCISY